MMRAASTLLRQAAAPMLTKGAATVGRRAPGPHARPAAPLSFIRGDALGGVVVMVPEKRLLTVAPYAEAAALVDLFASVGLHVAAAEADLVVSGPSVQGERVDEFFDREVGHHTLVLALSGSGQDEGGPWLPAPDEPWAHLYADPWGWRGAADAWCRDLLGMQIAQRIWHARRLLMGIFAAGLISALQRGELRLQGAPAGQPAAEWIDRAWIDEASLRLDFLSARLAPGPADAGTYPCWVAVRLFPAQDSAEVGKAAPAAGAVVAKPARVRMKDVAAGSPKPRGRPSDTRRIRALAQMLFWIRHHEGNSSTLGGGGVKINAAFGALLARAIGYPDMSQDTLRSDAERLQNPGVALKLKVPKPFEVIACAAICCADDFDSSHVVTERIDQAILEFCNQAVAGMIDSNWITHRKGLEAPDVKRPQRKPLIDELRRIIGRERPAFHEFKGYGDGLLLVPFPLEAARPVPSRPRSRG